MKHVVASLGLAVLLLVVPSSTVAAPAGSITWTVDHEAKTISVMVRLQIYSGCSGNPEGSAEERASACNLPRSMLAGPTQFLADKIKAQVERVWNKPYHYFCYELKVEVDVKLGTDHASLDSDRIGVRIDPSPVSIRSFVNGRQPARAEWNSEDPAHRLDATNDGEASTSWAESPRSTTTYAHEFGHILGLDDSYDEAGDPRPGAPIDLMSTAGVSRIDQSTINRLIRRNLPLMKDTEGNPVTEDDLKCDYQGTWTGPRMAGTIRYCGKTENPYWGMDLVTATGDRGFVAYDIPAGSETAVQGELVTPFVVSDWDSHAAGTGAYIDGDPPHFLVDIGEGTFIVTLDEGSFCQYAPR